MIFLKTKTERRHRYRSEDRRAGEIRNCKNITNLLVISAIFLDSADPLRVLRRSVVHRRLWQPSFLDGHVASRWKIMMTAHPYLARWWDRHLMCCSVGMLIEWCKIDRQAGRWPKNEKWKMNWVLTDDSGNSTWKRAATKAAKAQYSNRSRAL